MSPHGIHHLTAVSAAIRDNYRFYTETIGMRLVKRSVNQDDVSAYHLFYSDAVGTPGHDLTFFDWPVPPEQRGTRSVVRTGLRVPAASLDYWTDRLAAAGVEAEPVRVIDGRLTLRFEDPEGQRLALLADGGAGDPPTPWDRSPVPAEHQIRGLGPITMSVPDLENTDLALRTVLGMRLVRTYPLPDRPADTVHVYEMGEGGGPHAELHVAVQPRLPVARQGAGAVHHVAFRVPDDAYDDWSERLQRFGVPSSGPVDRYYFRSLYFREPGGVLFELATDGPGFAVDEDAATLGETVVLPPILESRRTQIVAGLKPLD
ncbi:ring-cleaving dioxygenase [Rubricoccus marinus]|uniref:Ring-cleaving dioxygenase n=1 Tax=Rubricoccus marinus TaxID=716817 RepID=A0A259TUA3_9BACT|nr:ring-cleaving dioxygenase [Rubricoccus marinus]OZC01311.1 ring-cleaving dioxygenase [Rubricoccus marinus]